MTAAAALLALACAAIGAAAGWYARANYSVAPNGSRGNPPETPDGSPATPFMVEAVVRIPVVLFAAPIYGLGLEISGLLVSDVDAADPDDGTDPATGLSFGDPGDAPESEQ